MRREKIEPSNPIIFATQPDGASLDGARLVGASLEDIYWDKETQWSNISGLKEALNVPEALKEQLGLS